MKFGRPGSALKPHADLFVPALEQLGTAAKYRGCIGVTPEGEEGLAKRIQRVGTFGRVGHKP